MAARILIRPVEDYLTGYEAADGSWRKGLIQFAEEVSKKMNFILWGAVGFGLAHFMGWDTAAKFVSLAQNVMLVMPVLPLFL